MQAGLASLVWLALGTHSGVAAPLCDVSYRVQAGDTLSSIAARHYGDADDWTALYYANLAVMPPADAAAPLVAGVDLYVPCPPGAAPAEPDLVPGAAEVTLGLDAGFAPFSDRTWPGGGMGAALLSEALDEAPDRLTHRRDWSGGASDIRFPLIVHGCAEGRDICSEYHLSQPLFDLPIMLFVKVGSDMGYAQDADILGRRLCRPEGEGIGDLDRADRRWISEGRVTLLRGPSVEACLEMVMQGTVDAAAIDLYRGATKVSAMGIGGRVAPLEVPLSRMRLHAAVPRTHWRGTALIYRLNAGLDRLRASGRWDEITREHMGTLGTLLR